MGLLDRVAMKAERKRLAPFFTSDERFVQTDVCELVSAEFQPEGTRLPGGPAALSLTNKAVYFRRTDSRNPDVIRIPYERIVVVVGHGPLLEFTTATGGDYLFRDVGRPMGDDKHTLITAELTRRENHRQTVLLPSGGTAELINRSLDEDRGPEWLIAGDFDRSDPANRATIESALAPAIMRLGPIRWPS